MTRKDYENIAAELRSQYALMTAESSDMRQGYRYAVLTVADALANSKLFNRDRFIAATGIYEGAA